MDDSGFYVSTEHIERRVEQLERDVMVLKSKRARFVTFFIGAVLGFLLGSL